MADYKIEIEADVARAIKSIDDLRDQVEELTEEFRESDRGIGSFAESMISINGVINLAQQGFALAKSAISQFGAVLQEAGEVEGISRGFENLQKSVGAFGSETITALRENTRGLVSDFQLMEAANNAVLLGVDDGSGKFAEMAEAAVKLGQAAGRTATEAINDLTVGIGRGSKQILDNLGVVVDANKAYQKFADANGLLADKLTDSQKKAAFQAEAFEQITNKASKLPEIVESGATEFTRFNTVLDNARAELVSVISENEDLQAGIANLTRALRDIDIAEIANLIALLGGHLFDLTADLVEVTGKVIEFGRSLKDFVIDPYTKIKRLLAGDDPIQNAASSAAEATNAVGAAGLGGAMFELASSARLATEASAEQRAEMARVAAQADKTKKKIKEYYSENVLGPGNYEGQLEFDKIQFDQSLEKQLGEAFNEVIVGALDLALNGGDSGDYGSLFGGAGGQALGTYFGGPIGGQIGQQIGSKLGSEIFSSISDAFGGNKDEQANARESFESFIREALDANNLQLVIDGQLQELDFTISGGRKAFSGEDGGLFSTAFEGLEDSAVAAFTGVGNAFNELLNTGEDIGAQLGAIFADNLGGDLNNLQLLLQSSGVSAEQMGDSLREAFLEGNLSAIETLDGLRAVEDIMKKGIPGATGAIDKAFDNLVKGAGTGRQAADAVVDVFAEAKEVGIDSLGALEQRLIDLGTPAQQVEQFMEAIAETGIRSIDEGLNQSLDQTIQILADLESQNFEFLGGLDEGIARVDKVINRLDEIPNEITKRVNFDVRVTGDQIPAGIIDTPGLG